MIASTQTNHPLAGVKVLTRHGEELTTPINQAIARLRSAGLRVTQPRIAILEALICFGKPASIEQIHEVLKRAACDLVTVYRCLSAFDGLGLVRRSFLPNGTSLYEINLGETSRYHVICKESHRVEVIDSETTAELRAAIAGIEEKLAAKGYTNLSHVVEFFGVGQPAKNRNASPVIRAEA
jgi:Fur family ferric uptake transcriptional regulator